MKKDLGSACLFVGGILYGFALNVPSDGAAWWSFLTSVALVTLGYFLVWSAHSCD